MRLAITILLTANLSLFLALPVCAEIRFHWESPFNAGEKSKLMSWIKQTDQALTEIVGKQPYTRHIYFHALPYSKEPVPWAHTERGRQQGVHFYVDPRFSEEDFLEDWTAPHELSHLLLPYLGQQYAWFAEGFASYMQYQVMQSMGVITQQEANKRYQKRFAKAERRFDMDHLPFSMAAAKLREQRQYSTMYWGGAVYFKQVDDWLQQHKQTDLNAVLARFIACCRHSSKGLSALMTNLNHSSQSQVFSSHLEWYRTQPGFPSYRKPLDLKPRSG